MAPESGSLTWLIKPTGSPCFAVRFRDPRTGEVRQKSTRTANKRDAQRFEDDLRRQLERNELDLRAPISWDEARERYEDEVLAHLAKATEQKSVTALNSVGKIIAPRLLKDLDASSLSRWVAELAKKKRSADTIAGYVAHVRAFLNWHVEMENLQRCPKLRKPRRTKSGGAKSPMKGRPLTPGEIDRMLAAVPKVVAAPAVDSYCHLIRGLESSGLRLQEAMNLSWSEGAGLSVDLSTERPTFRINADFEKGHQDRILPLAPEFAELLMETPEDRRSGFVFSPLDRRGRNRVTFNCVSHVISRIGKKAGIVVQRNAQTGKTKFASAHDLRRTFGERWAKRVMPSVLQTLMRHQSISTTMRFYVQHEALSVNEILYQSVAEKQK